ncbi:MAG: undecaprenyl-phosphate glucose phosphotransferase [Pseudomonadota bacterium]
MSIPSPDAAERSQPKSTRDARERRAIPQARRVILSEDARAAMEDAKTNVITPAVLLGIVRAAEFFGILAVGAIIYGAYVVPKAGIQGSYLTAVGIVPLLAVIAFQGARLYTVQALRRPFERMPRMGIAWMATFAVLAVVSFFGQAGDMFSRVLFASWFLVGFATLILWRFALSAKIMKWTREGRLTRRAVVVGGGTNAENLIEALSSTDDTGITILGLFDDRDEKRSPKHQAGLRKLGTVDELVVFARQTQIDLMIVTLPVTAERRVLEMMKKLWILPVDIRLSAHSSELRYAKKAYSYIGNVPFLDVLDRPLSEWDVLIKAVFDRVFAVLGLIALSPIMLATALAVKLESKGPVFFRQKRYGFNNELIEVFKFRSMYTDMCDAQAAKLVTKDDPRVTKVGKFIRKTSIDELPQLFNVLTGELSLVGPRPHALQAKAADALYDEVVDGYFARHRVKPGITGWAQINGWRGETDTREKIERRVEHDLYYIENWSAFFDFYICLMTPLRLMKTENAY